MIENVTIAQNETVTIKTDPEFVDASTIQWLYFSSSSIYSLPWEIFNEFYNLKTFRAEHSNVQEIKASTFSARWELQQIDLWNNSVAFLHVATFQGKISTSLYFLLIFLFLEIILTGLKNLKEIDLNNNQLEHLHHDTFKNNLKLTHIRLSGNKLSSLHPKMFAHLTDLRDLWLSFNTCIDKYFLPVTSSAAVEKELMTCGTGYALTEQLQNLQNRHERKFESIENQLKTIDEKFSSLQTQLTEREKKVDRELEQVSELFAYVYQGNKENSAEIIDIKKTADQILEILSSQ
jgi:Leucine-rich repeat (LRR) protein